MSGNGTVYAGDDYAAACMRNPLTMTCGADSHNSVPQSDYIPLFNKRKVRDVRLCRFRYLRTVRHRVFTFNSYVSTAFLGHFEE